MGQKSGLQLHSIFLDVLESNAEKGMLADFIMSVVLLLMSIVYLSTVQKLCFDVSDTL